MALKCPHCGEPVYPNDSVCMACGKSLLPTPQASLGTTVSSDASSQPPAPAPRKNACRWCGKRAGWLSPLTPNGVCADCQNAIAIDVAQRVRIIEDSSRLVDEGKKLETRLSRLDLLLEHARVLWEFERRGIPTVDPPPSAIIAEYRDKHDELILDSMGSEARSAIIKSDTATTTRTKLTPLTNALAKVRHHKAEVNDPIRLFQLEAELTARSNLIQLNDFLDKARKAEFKGQQKKALDQYLEALYFLKTDETDGSLQAEYIEGVEAKVVELGGDLPPAPTEPDIDVTLH